MMLDRLDTKGRRDMCFACSRPADKEIFCAPCGNSQRCSWRTVASLISLAAKLKPEMSLSAGKRSAFM